MDAYRFPNVQNAFPVSSYRFPVHFRREFARKPMILDRFRRAIITITAEFAKFPVYFPVSRESQCGDPFGRTACTASPINCNILCCSRARDKAQRLRASKHKSPHSAMLADA